MIQTKTTKLLTLTAGAALAMAVGSAQAAPLFSEDFEGVDPLSNFTSDRIDIQSTGSPFGAGNTYAFFNDTSQAAPRGRLMANAFALPGDGVVSGFMDVFAFDGSREDQVAVGFSNGGDLNSGNRISRFLVDPGNLNIRLPDGTTFNISEDTAYTTAYILNTSTTTITDYFGSQDLVGESADLWVKPMNGSSWTFVGTQLGLENAPGTTIRYGVASGGNTDRTNTLYVDNYLVEGGAVVPEPASLALMGLGGLLMLGRGRRSQR